MTVTYSAEVATSRGFGCFWKLLFRWRGSIYKLLWPDLSFYLFVYYFLSIIYRFILSESQRRYFEKISIYCKTYGDLIPVSFILGFYVSIVVKRWWDCFNCIPWPDTLAFFVSAYIHGQDERGRLMRRSIMRYVNLAFVITMTCISPCVKKRFPTMDHLVEAGILLPNEKKIMEQLTTSHSTYWMPLVWASSIAIRARKEGRIRDDFALNTLISAIATYRSLCGGLYNYDWISIPLVYTQVVTLVVYTFFLATLMGRQYLDPTQKHIGYEIDLYVPIFNFLQFFFYMGWLKVAETLVNPFGEDDDDFEVNWVIDRDIQVSYLIVDEMHQEHPELIKDQYWDEVLPDLPYTAASMPFYSEPPKGSAADMIIPPHEAEFVPLEPLAEDEDDELSTVKVNGIPFTTHRSSNRLSQNLSGSAYSGISRLGHSFHPMSYERKGILNLMQDFLSRDASSKDLLSRESSVRKKLYKTQSKDTVDPSPSCQTSSPPSPEEVRGKMRGYNDDIFYLSDLSLADSRGTGIAQSPGLISNAQDFFSRKKSERPLRRNLSNKVSTPEILTPRSDLTDDDGLMMRRIPPALRKKRTNSFKNFFRSKSRGSQKSLNREYNVRSRQCLRSTAELYFGDSDFPRRVEKVDTSSFDDDQSLNNSDEDITVQEAYPVSQNISKSNINIGDSKISDPISFEHRRKSSHQVFSTPPDNFNSAKLVKEPSTSTLVPGEGSLEGTPPSAPEINSGDALNISVEGIKTMSGDTDISSVRSSPSLTKTPETPLLQKKLLSKLKPTRTVSLHLSDAKKEEDRKLTGLQKLYKRRKSQSFFHTASQPVSPIEIHPPSTASSTIRGIFSRRFSKGSESLSAAGSSLAGLLSRRPSKDKSPSGVNFSESDTVSRRPSKESTSPRTVSPSMGGLLNESPSKDESQSGLDSAQGDIIGRRLSKESVSPSAVSPTLSGLKSKRPSKDESLNGVDSSQSSTVGRRLSKESESPRTVSPLFVGSSSSRRLSKEVDSPGAVDSSEGNIFINKLNEEDELPSASTSPQSSLFMRRMNKDGNAVDKPLKSLHIQENPDIIVLENFVEEKNRKNRMISDV